VPDVLLKTTNAGALRKHRGYAVRCPSGRVPTFGEFAPRLGISATFREKLGNWGM